MKTRNGFMDLLAAAVSLGAGYAHIPAKVYEDYRRKSGGKKSSAGRGTVRINSPEYTGWKRLFGGVAVPRFFDLSAAASKHRKSFARGPRPDTWHKRHRKTRKADSVHSL